MDNINNDDNGVEYMLGTKDFKLIPDMMFSQQYDYDRFLNYNKLLIEKILSSNDSSINIDIFILLRSVKSELKIFDLNRDGDKIDRNIRELSKNNKLILTILGELYEEMFAFIYKSIRVEYLGLVVEDKISIHLKVLEPFNIRIPSGGTDVIEAGEILSISSIGEFAIIKIDNSDYKRNLAGNQSKLYIDILDSETRDSMKAITKTKSINHLSMSVDYNESTPWFITAKKEKDITDLGIDKRSVGVIKKDKDILYYVRINNTKWNFNEGHIIINAISGEEGQYTITNDDIYNKLCTNSIMNLTYEIYK